MLSRHSSIALCAVMVACAGLVSFAQAQQRTQTRPQPRTKSSAGTQRQGGNGPNRQSPGQATTRSGTPARTVSSSQGGTAGRTVPSQPVSPELQELLQAWHNSSSLIKRLEGKHIRRVYDTVFSIEKRSVGQFFYEAPDRGRIDIDKFSVKKGDVSQRLKADKVTPFKLQSDKPEQWICDGTQIFSVNRQDKQAEVFEIPVAARGENIMNGPLPFLFGMPPEMAKQRYNLTLLKARPGQKSVQLKAVPKWKQDAANWQEAKIILDRKSFLPLHIQLKDPTGNTITVYSFGNMIVNKQPRSKFFKINPFKPNLIGFKVNAHNEKTMKAGLKNRREEDKNLRNEIEKTKTKISSGPVTPDVRGYAWKDAKERLERMGMTVKIFRGPVAKRQEDVYQVASQIPAALSGLPTDKTVRLTVFTAAKTADSKSGGGTR
jgi:TIGR03009 family protein